MPNEDGEHLLLAPLGESPGAVLSLLDCLNRPDEWDEGRRLPGVPPVSDLWVITTSARHTAASLEQGFPRELAFMGTAAPARRRLLVANGIDDICSDRDHQAMAELLFRLVLQGEGWRNAKPGRKFSVSISGGRKTMSADLQQAATFFEVDYVLQMVYNPARSRPEPQTLRDIRESRECHFPVVLSRQPTPWRDLLAKPWLDEHPTVLLDASYFPLDDDWRESRPPAGQPFRVSAVPVYEASHEEPKELRLRDGARAVAERTKEYATRTLASGVGPLFLRHDLKGVIERLLREPSDRQGPGAWEAQARRDLGVLADYLLGLSQIIDTDPTPWAGSGVVVDQLPDLIDQALTLAAATRVGPRQQQGDAWHWQFDVPRKGENRPLTLTLHGLPGEAGLELAGVSQRALLPLLRNLLANALRHGGADRDGRVPVTIEVADEVRPEGRDLVLKFRNLVSDPGQQDYLYRLAELEGGPLKLLVQPSQRGPASEGDGLGLFTLSRIERRSEGAVKIEGPVLDPPAREPGKDVHFVIAVRFTAR